MRVQLEIDVCDRCQDPSKKVAIYTVEKVGGNKESVTLCGTHAKPLEVILGNIKSPGGRPAKKAAAKKAARKRA